MSRWKTKGKPNTGKRVPKDILFLVAMDSDII